MVVKTRPAHFTDATFDFLAELSANNNRDWFTANKSRYEKHVKGPALQLISDFAGPLARLSPHFEASPKSLFRIHRDTRFSTDKRPYKTHTGIHFRYKDSTTAYAPGYYLHLQPGQVFAGLGIWHPEPDTLKAIRDRIVEKPEGWKKASRDRRLTATYELEGDRLTRPPKGYPVDHPLVEDLKRKDFVAMKRLDESFVTEPGLPERLAELWAIGTPYMRFLCQANGLSFSRIQNTE
jgi:uncharacterized protein (TIGR02453 family)